MFRNESTNVIRKAKAKAASKSRSVSPGAKPSTPPPPPLSSEQDIEDSLILGRRNDAPTPKPAISYYSMAPTIDERAVGFFFINFIIDTDSRSGDSAGYRLDDNLLICVKAVGLAALSSAAHAPGLVQRYVDEVAFLDPAVQSKVSDVKGRKQVYPHCARCMGVQI